MRYPILASALLSCLFCLSAFAQPVIILEDSRPGTYILKVTIGANGKATAKVMTNVVTLDVGDAAISPTDGEVENKFGLAAFTKAQAAKVKDPDTSEGIGTIYKLIADKIRNGEITEAQVAATAVKESTNIFLGNTNKKKKWQAFSNSLETELEKLSAAGKIKTVKDVEQAFREISSGMTNRGKIDPSLLTLIIKIIEIVMQLLLNRGM